MLVFVVPLKSMQASTSWEQVSNLFERCIKSICNQTSANFRVIVVCHEKPNIDFSHPSIRYLEANFPPPQNLDLLSKRADSERKIVTGLKAAQEFEPCHVMKVDADDCVSKYLAEFVAQQPQANGWVINRGYEYKDGSRFIYLRKNNFHIHCGTANIIKYELLEFPEQHETMDFKSISSYSIPHSRMIDIMAKKGTPIKPLPFAGAVYIIKHGENTEPRVRKYSNFFRDYKEAILISKEIYRGISSKILTPSIRTEFGLYTLNRNEK